ncbi:MAG: hypothetical protein ACE5IL_00455 [Myxococcota bacterium]
MRLPLLASPANLVLALLVMAALVPSPPARAQSQPRRVELPIAFYAVQYLRGRFEMPVLCTRDDGEVVRVEESLTFKPSRNRDANQTLRVTFFGLPWEGMQRCYNVALGRIPDRRGVIFIRYANLEKRPDVGLRDFQRDLQRGPLEYRVVGGSLRIREVGSGAAEGRKVDFSGRSVPFRVELIRRNSDADKLLGRVQPVKGRQPRKLGFEIVGPDDFRYRGSYLEDSSRW